MHYLGLTHKYGEDTVRGLNDALVLKLKEGKVVRGKKLRIDTTVVESDIHHPTDTGLLMDGIRTITRVISKLKKAVPGVGSQFVNHTRKAKKVYLGLMKVIKGRTGKDDTALKKARDELVKITGEAITGGHAVQAEVNLLREKAPLVNRLKGKLSELVKTAERVVWQTQEVIKGNRHLPRRLVSLFDVDARPIRRGKSQADTEFGRKVFLGETDHGIISTYQVVEDNPSDVTLLKPMVKGHKRLFRKRLKAVTGDRGFYSQANENWLKSEGVKQTSIPKRGRISGDRKRHQHQPWFKRLQRFRAGIEARISLLKRKFGLKRSRLRGSPGFNIWVGQGIFTHNLWQAARMI